jgi:hypothetical protein
MPLHSVTFELMFLLQTSALVGLLHIVILSIFRQPLHVTGVSRPIIRRYNPMCTVCCPGWVGTIQPGQQTVQSSKNNKKYQLLYTYGCTS